MVAQWTEIGMGGALALLVIREVLNFLKVQKQRNHKPNAAAGEKSTEFWTVAFNQIVEEKIRPVLNNQERLSDKFEKITDAITTKVDAIPGGRHIITDKLDKITDAFTTNRSVIIEKLDKIIELLLKR